MKKVKILSVIITVLLTLCATTILVRAGLHGVATGTIRDVELVFFYRGSVFFSDATSLLEVTRKGEKKKLLQRSDLGIYMDFSNDLKVIETYSQILLLDAKNKLIRSIKIDVSGQVLLSNQGKYIAVLNEMEETFLLFDVKGRPIQIAALHEIPGSIVFSEDDSQIITNRGQVINLQQNKVTSYFYENIMFDTIDLVGNKKVLCSGLQVIPTVSKQVHLFDLNGKIIWRKNFQDANTAFSILTDRVVFYADDFVECLDLLSGKTLWKKTFQKIKHNVFQDNRRSQYAIFQTNDHVLHVLDKNGKEVAQKQIGKVRNLYFGENNIMYIDEQNKFTVLRIDG